MAEIKSFPNNQDVYVGAEWVMKWLHGRTSGVFSAENNLSTSVVPDSMSVEISDGVGWLSNENGDGIVFWNDSEQSNGSKLRLTHDVADGALDRIDRIVVTWETTNYVALPTISILKGTASSNPVAPALTNDNVQRQISLAKVSIPAGTVSLLQTMLTDERLDPKVCGIVTETVKIDTSTMHNQFEALLEAIQNELRDLNDGTAALLKAGGTMYGDIDMDNNSIKNVATPENASDVVNKEYADKKISIDLLWENASPGSEFAAQKVYMDLTAYDYVSVAFIRSKGSNVLKEFSMCKHKEKIDTRLPMEKVIHYRLASVHADRVEFTNSQYIVYGNTAKTTDNKMLIPVRIYGIKGVSA